jgi:hypothetical protein
MWQLPPPWWYLARWLLARSNQKERRLSTRLHSSAESIMPLPLDPAFPADHSVIDEFNRHEEKRDYWYGRARECQAEGTVANADASRTTAREYRNRLDKDNGRLSDAYRKAHSSDIYRALAGN